MAYGKGFAELFANCAKNPVLSTMKKDLGTIGRSMKGGYSNASNVMSTGGFSGKTKANLIGGDMKRRGMGIYNELGAAKTAGYAAGGLGVGAAAADFANPWGLGWGD